MTSTTMRLRRRPSTINSRAKSSCRLRFEALEARIVLDGRVVISEILADNDSTLFDYDEDSPAVVEFFNSGSEPVDLHGYYVTDDPEEPTKWQVPVSTTIDSLDRTVIFASGKGGTRFPTSVAPNGELHTSFQLSSRGESLALVMPDGQTMVHQFDFPMQAEDVSYGFPTESTLVDPSQEAQWLVPTDASQLPNNWFDPSLDDSSWSSGKFGFGFDTSDSMPGLRLWLKADDIVDGPEPDTGAAVPLWQDHSGNGHDAAVPTDLGLALGDPTRGEFTLDVAGESKTVPVIEFSSDGAEELLRAEDIINGPDNNDEAQEAEGFGEATVVTVYAWNGRQFTDVFAGFGLRTKRQRPGLDVDNFQLSHFPAIATGNRTLGLGNYLAPAPRRKLFMRMATMSVEDDGQVEEFFDGERVLSTKNLNFGIRSDHFYLGDLHNNSTDLQLAEVMVFDRALHEMERVVVNRYLQQKYFAADIPTDEISFGPFAPLFETDLRGTMHGQNASVFLRSHFDVPAENPLDRLILRLRHDDGVVVYLNGVEVVRRNAPELLGWNAAAPSDRPDEQAFAIEDIDLTDHLQLLQPTGNVLAIQGLNVTADDAQFLSWVELVGLTEPSTATEAYFAEPTLGAQNAEPSVGILMQPTHSVEGGVFTDASIAVELTVELFGDDMQNAIHYTTDGSVPTQASPQYVGPILIDATTQLRARVYRPGYVPSRTTSHTYFKVGPKNDSNYLGTDLLNFSTDLPVIVIETFGSVPNQIEFTDSTIALFEPGADGRTRLIHAPTALARSGLKIRGTASSSRPKRPYALELRNDHNDRDREVSLAGLPEESDWVLYGPFDSDLTLINNTLPFRLTELFAQVTGKDYYVPRSQFIELFVNEVDAQLTADDYAGLYVLMEKIKRDNNRIDIAKPSSKHTIEPDITGGYIFKFDSADPEDLGFMTPVLGWTVRYVEPKEVEITPAQQEYILGFFGEFESTLSSGNSAAYADVDSFVDLNLINEVVRDIEGISRSTFFYKDRNGILVFGPAWDHDKSQTFELQGPDGLASAEVWYRGGPWFGHMLESPDIRQKYIDRYQSLRDSIFRTDNMVSLIDSLASEIEEAQPRDLSRWSGTVAPRNEPSIELLDGTWAGEIEFLKEWHRRRLAWLDTKFLQPPQLNHTGDIAAGPVELTISGPVDATLYYTTDGSDPRLPGGALSARAETYTGPIRIESGATITVRSFDASFPSDFYFREVSPWSGPVQTSFTVGSPDALRITEINYNPAGPDDTEFLELKNIGDQPINLAGLRFTQGIEFTFPNQELGPDEYVVVAKDLTAFNALYTDGNMNVIGPFTGGSLANGGERISLVDTQDGVLLDFEYGDADPWPQPADGSGATLQLIDAGSTPPAEHLGKYYHWRASTQPGGSPGGPDVIEPVGVVINEVLSHTDLPVTQSDSIELYNTTDTEIDISGWWLSDSDNDFFKYQIPAGTQLPAHGYVVFDERHFNPTPDTPTDKHFALSGTNGDDVWLVRDNGNGGVGQFVDDVHFGAARNGESFGRTAHGTGRLAPTLSLTLNGPNTSPRVGPLVISEVQYNPGEPTAADLALAAAMTEDDLEFAEVFNPTEQTVDLTGWRLRAGVDYEFDAGTQLASGETLVVVSFDLARAANAPLVEAFRSHYRIDESVRLVGSYAGQLSDSGEPVRLRRADDPGEGGGQIPHVLEDEVLYDDLAPWPTEADGQGRSLTRTSAMDWGNDAASWTATNPTPGSVSFQLLGDMDLDEDLDCDDIDDFVLGLSDPFAYEALFGVPATLHGDTDQDGDLDFDDIDDFLLLLGDAPTTKAGNEVGLSDSAPTTSLRPAEVDAALELDFKEKIVRSPERTRKDQRDRKD